jgi:hypothetical protein
MDILQSVGVGTISGIVASAIVFGFTVVFQRMLLPWYRQFVYRGVNITGVWKATSASSNRTLIFDLIQKAHSVEGSVSIITAKDIPASIRSFTLAGTLSDRFLEFQMRHVDSKQLGIAVGLFEVIGDGNKMKGFLTGYKVKLYAIEADEVELTRSLSTDKE